MVTGKLKTEVLIYVIEVGKSVLYLCFSSATLKKKLLHSSETACLV